ncbi:TonB-dependent receptor, partial [Klebsiella pneumoniae]
RFELTVARGKRPAEVPRNMASLWADYTFHETALSGLTIGAGARYIGSTVSYYKNDTSTGKKNDAFSVAGYAPRRLTSGWRWACQSWYVLESIRR